MIRFKNIIKFKAYSKYANLKIYKNKNPKTIIIKILILIFIVTHYL